MIAPGGSDSGDAQSGIGQRPLGQPGNSRRWLIVAGVVVVAVVAVGAVVLSGGGGADTTAAASQATATTSIRQQDLVESETVDGSLGYSDARTVVNRLAGTVTWTPRSGSVVKANHRLYEVDGKAVYLLDGSYPAYRTLQAGLKGDDVRQLERNLRRLGLDADRDMTVDGSWDPGTTAAVKRWQARKGMQQDGTIEHGRIVFQPGSRRIGDIRLEAGSSASGAVGGPSPASYQSDKAPRTTFASAPADQTTSRGFSDVPVASAAQVTPPQTTPTETTAPTTTTPATPAPTGTTPAPTTTTPTTSTPTTTTPTTSTPTTSTPTTPKPEKPKPPGTRQTAPSGGAAAAGRANGRRSAAAGASAMRTSDAGGDGGGRTAPGGAPPGSYVAVALMTTTSTKRIVTVDLEATKQALAREGAAVIVQLPDDSNVAGTIARVGKVAQKKATPMNEDPPATIKLIIKLKKSTGTGLDQAPVDVKLERQRAKDVLTVPVTALLARAGGEFAVELREGDRRQVVQVETGLYTDSYVEIEGKGLRPGLKVTNAEI